MLSVIIPNYNGEKTVDKTIKSVYGMKCEIIVVDDCSTDNSVKMIKRKFPKVKILKNDSVKWTAYSRNLGIRESKGDYLLFLDNDIFMSPDTVKKMLAKIKTSDLVFPTVDFENGVRMRPRPNYDMDYVGSCAFMISKKAINKLDEFFDETYQFYMEDSDFFFRCVMGKMKLKHVTDAIAIHVLKDKVSNQIQKYYFRVRNMIYFYAKTGQLNFGLLKFLMVNFFINCMLNYSERLRYQESDQSESFLEKIKVLIKHPKMTDRRLDLFKAYFRGVWWNIKNYNYIREKRNTLKTYYEQRR